MSIKHRTKSNTTGDFTTCVVLVSSILLICILILVMLALHFSTKLDQKLLDLEACQYLLDEDGPGSYGTFQSSPYTRDDLEARRRLRHEQICHDISGVYRISVQRLEEDEVSSSSSDESASNIATAYKADIVDGESGEESSETESESSDDSSSESPEDVEVSRLMSMKKPLLPKRVAVLKSM